MFSNSLRTFCIKILLYFIDLANNWIAKLDEEKEATDDTQVEFKADESRVAFKYGEFLNKDYEIRVGNCTDEMLPATISKIEKINDNTEFTSSTQIQTTDDTPLTTICKIPVMKNMIIPPMDKQKIFASLFENAKDNDVEEMGYELLRNIVRSSNELPWLTNYMVIERISKEPELHEKYLNLLDYLDRDVIDKSMVSITIDNIRIMLKTKSKYDLFAIQNLSNWLTLITLSEKRARFIDASKLEKIQLNVDKCIDELLPKTMNTTVKINDNKEITPPTQIQITGNIPMSSICQIPVGKKMVIPPADKQKLIDELFENAKEDDVENWARELRKIMGKKNDLPWLVEYMIKNRISKEPEHQRIYLQLIEYLKSDLFDKAMVANTIENLRIMLKNKSRYDIFAMQNLSRWLSLIIRSERRRLLVDPNNLEKIQLEVKKCTEELLSGVGRKFTKKIINSKSTPSTYGRKTRN